MNVLIVGCGKVGIPAGKTANTQWGHNGSVEGPGRGYVRSAWREDFDGVTVTGMPMDMDVLRSAGVEWCDAVAVVTRCTPLEYHHLPDCKDFFHVEKRVTRISDSGPRWRSISLGCLLYVPPIWW